MKTSAHPVHPVDTGAGMRVGVGTIAPGVDKLGRFLYHF